MTTWTARQTWRTAAVILLWALATSASLRAQVDSRLATPLPADPKNFWRAVGGGLAANILVWGVDRFVRNEPWARVGTRSWAHNFHQGFEWDTNAFHVNQLAHPYHGSQYFGAARVNGYGFWGAVPFTAAGSLMWEFLAETERPSLNDFLNTTLGGIALGEITHRLSFRVRSDASAGKVGIGRAIGALALNVGGGLGGGGLSRTSMSPATPNIPLRQKWISGYGWQRTSPASHASHSVLVMQIESGTPFDTAALRPYDAFELQIEFASHVSTVVTGLQVSGLLGRRFLRRTDRSQLVLAAFQDYEYVDTGTYAWARQGLAAGVLYRRRLTPRLDFDFGGRVSPTILGCVSSESPGAIGQHCDYGPGVGFTAAGSVRWDQREVLRLERTTAWIHSINGADADHTGTFTRIGLQIPATRWFDLGGEMAILIRDSRYPRLLVVTQQATQVRAYIILGIS